MIVVYFTVNLLLIATEVESNIIIPEKRCVPTSKMQSNCHVCICDSHGVYSCFKTPGCQVAIPNATDKVAFRTLPAIENDSECVPGKLYKQSCNICKCNEVEGKNELLCTKMACIGDLPHIKRPKSVPRQSKANVNRKGDADADAKPNTNANIDDIFRVKLKQIPSLPVHDACTKGYVYKNGCNFCFCDYKEKSYCVPAKRKCDHTIGKAYITEIESPEEVYPPVEDEAFIDLEPLPHVASKCEPGQVYRVVCDVCLCLHTGNLLCTNRLCLSQDGMNRKQATRWTGHGCDVRPSIKNQCLKCECIEDKLKCTAIDGCKVVLRSLHGSFRLNDTSLSFQTEKCTPAESYAAQCNMCHCQEDGSLRCTQKTCLNHEQSSVLLRHREELEKNGL